MLERIKKNYFLLISLFLIIYILFNLLTGERGLISYFEKKNLLKNLKNEELRNLKVIHLSNQEKIAMSSMIRTYL